MTLADAPFIIQINNLCTDLAATDWCEGSAGNFSLLLERDEVKPWLDLKSASGMQIDLGESPETLAGKYLLISGSGERLNRISRDPEKSLALLEISSNGDTCRLVWGLREGGKPSSELMVHLLGHHARLAETGRSKAILHTHPIYAVVLSVIQPMNNRELSHILWRFHTEGAAVFPEGAAFLPVTALTPPGSEYLAKQTADCFRRHRYVMWERHGTIVAGDSLDECFMQNQVAEKLFRIAYLSSNAGQQAIQYLKHYQMRYHLLEAVGKPFGVDNKHRYWEV